MTEIIYEAPREIHVKTYSWNTHPLNYGSLRKKIFKSSITALSQRWASFRLGVEYTY